MKRIASLIGVLTILALMATACAPAATEAPPPAAATEAPPPAAATEAPTAAPPAEEKPFKVGLLSPGPVNDQGWAQTAYDAFVRIEKELGAEMSYVELEENPAAFEKAFRDYASEGYTMVLGHGNQFTDAAKAVAPEFPDTWFFLSSSRFNGPAEGIPNLIGLNTDSAQAYFVLGVIAASMGNGGGIVGGVEIPPISETMTGFINGARYTKSDFPVVTTYLGNWTDVAAAKESALSMVSEGVDFLLPNANIAGNGVYQAIVEADVWGFGTYRPSRDADKFDQCPENCLANYVLDYGQGLVGLAKQIKEGTFAPTGNIEFGLQDSDVLYIVYNENAKQVVPEPVRELVSEAAQKIASGEINHLEGHPLTSNP